MPKALLPSSSSSCASSCTGSASCGSSSSLYASNDRAGNAPTSSGVGDAVQPICGVLYDSFEVNASSSGVGLAVQFGSMTFTAHAGPMVPYPPYAVAALARMLRVEPESGSNVGPACRMGDSHSIPIACRGSKIASDALLTTVTFALRVDADELSELPDVEVEGEARPWNSEAVEGDAKEAEKELSEPKCSEGSVLIADECSW